MTGVTGVIYTNFKVTPCNEKCNFFHIFCLRMRPKPTTIKKLMTIQRFNTYNEISNSPKNTPLFADIGCLKKKSQLRHKMTLFRIFIISFQNAINPVYDSVYSHNLHQF